MSQVNKKIKKILNTHYINPLTVQSLFDNIMSDLPESSNFKLDTDYDNELFKIEYSIEDVIHYHNVPIYSNDYKTVEYKGSEYEYF